MIMVTLTDELRDLALDHVNRTKVGTEHAHLVSAFERWPVGQNLRTSFRMEADMILVIAEALRWKTYTD